MSKKRKSCNHSNVLLRFSLLDQITNETTIFKINNDFNINTFNSRIENGSFLKGIPIVLVDSLASRKNIFNSCAYDASIPFYIEARTGNNVAVIYAFNPRRKNWVDRYQDTLAFNERTDEHPCAGSEMVPIIWAVASTITGILLKIKRQKVSRNEFIQVMCNFEHWPEIKTLVVEEI